MYLHQRYRSYDPDKNLIWRFYSDAAHHWRWQCLAYDGKVVKHSKSGYSQYESCLADAREHGHVFLPSLTSKAEKPALKVKRAYIRLTANHQKLVTQIVTEHVEQKEDMPADDLIRERDLVTQEVLL